MTKITRPEAMALLDADINEAQDAVLDLFPETLYWPEDRGMGGHRDIEPVRHRVLINMSFNLGHARLAGFRKFIAAVNAHDWATAAVEMMDSKWATQVGNRALRLRDMIRTGKDPV